jgi:uncharacterized protein YebE (UPF0316 family)
MLFDEVRPLLIPLLIFFARVIDVSIGTLRIIFVAKGLKYWAALLGFLEALIWILAISQVMQNLGSWQTYIAFAAGFAAGNYVGIAFEERIAMGNLIIRVITRHDAGKLVRHLRNSGYGVTSVDAQGESGQVKVIFTLVKRRQLESIVKSIKKYSPNAFYSIEDVRFAKETYYPPQAILSQKPAMELRPRK